MSRQPRSTSSSWLSPSATSSAGRGRVGGAQQELAVQPGLGGDGGAVDAQLAAGGGAQEPAQPGGQPGGDRCAFVGGQRSVSAIAARSSRENVNRWYGDFPEDADHTFAKIRMGSGESHPTTWNKI